MPMHVVLSTKYQEPWFSIAAEVKNILVGLGCTVYNPNTDNAEQYEQAANDRWLRTFTENLDIAKDTQGFVLQIQQLDFDDDVTDVAFMKSEMQIGEEWMSKNCRLPIMAVFGHQDTLGTSEWKEILEIDLEKAKFFAEKQWEHGIEDEVVICTSLVDEADEH